MWKTRIPKNMTSNAPKNWSDSLPQGKTLIQNVGFNKNWRHFPIELITYIYASHTRYTNITHNIAKGDTNNRKYANFSQNRREKKHTHTHPFANFTLPIAFPFVQEDTKKSSKNGLKNSPRRRLAMWLLNFSPINFENFRKFWKHTGQSWGRLSEVARWGMSLRILTRDPWILFSETCENETARDQAPSNCGEQTVAMS